MPSPAIISTWSTASAIKLSCPYTCHVLNVLSNLTLTIPPPKSSRAKPASLSNLISETFVTLTSLLLGSFSSVTVRLLPPPPKSVAERDLIPLRPVYLAPLII